MLPLMDKKKMTSVIIASRNEPKEELVSDVVADKPHALESCAAKILSAMKSDDPKALASAMQDFMDICSHEVSTKEEEE